MSSVTFKGTQRWKDFDKLKEVYPSVCCITDWGITMDAFTRQYVITALWSSMDNTDDQGGEPLDANYSFIDIAPETLAKMKVDCETFQKAHAADIAAEPEQSGHDFWLTRNHHGAGFWDGDWPEAVGKRLTQAAHTFGGVDLYVGDDGLIHG